MSIAPMSIFQTKSQLLVIFMGPMKKKNNKKQKENIQNK